jgi:diguanylate cyclase (GGDEF)-like protein
MCLDLDRFKAVNDTHGHAAGDLVLQEAARRLRAAVRHDDFVARLGGDEFVIIRLNDGAGGLHRADGRPHLRAPVRAL